MAGMRYSKMLIIALSGFFLAQGCASTEELFAEYDDKFSLATEHPTRKLRWEPAVYFGSDQSQILPADIAKLSMNAATLRQLPDYKISVKGFADNQAGISYNKTLSQQRVESVVEYLVDELNLDADRIISSFHGESTPLTQTQAVPVHLQHRVEMLLLDSALVPVASQPLLTQRSLNGAR